MIEAKPDSERSETVSSSGGQVDLTRLDDKHLRQYRHPNERRAFQAIVVAFILVGVALWVARPYLGDFLSFFPGPIFRFIDSVADPTRYGLILLVVLGVMAVVDAFGQWTQSSQLIAKAVELNPTTFPQLAPIVDELKGRFDLPRTRVFISRDAPLTGYTIGVREPYAIVFSTMGVGQFTPDEFKFMLGREMGHIKLGHTVAATVFGSANMSLPDPFGFLLKIRKFLFGGYQQGQELSCDRIGVVATRDVKPALSALIKITLGSVRGGKVDIKSLAPQTTELRQGLSGASVKLAQMLSSQPLAIARLAELTAWAGEPVDAPAASPAPAPAAETPPGGAAPGGPGPAGA